MPRICLPFTPGHFSRDFLVVHRMCNDDRVCVSMSSRRQLCAKSISLFSKSGWKYLSPNAIARWRSVASPRGRRSSASLAYWCVANAGLVIQGTHTLDVQHGMFHDTQRACSSCFWMQSSRYILMLAYSCFRKYIGQDLEWDAWISKCGSISERSKHDQKHLLCF